MDIAGGLYREICDVPHWNATFGSGGRAAAAVSALSPTSTLHTYVAASMETGARNIEALGIAVRRHQTDTAIAFAYFHPLSSPHIEPRRSMIAAADPISVHGEAILRFGFVEGDAVVHGGRVVYDPQTHHAPAPFNANGSRARSLALVMNELEIGTMEETGDVGIAAGRAMDRQGADVVVVKAGIRGATVFERGAAPRHVPAYRSNRVFKIGTGDVFSAIFAYHWAEAGMPAHEAAVLASQSVAAYCETRTLPLPADDHATLIPLSRHTPGPIEIAGAVDTIGRRWTMEEARFRLRELGLTAWAPSLGDEMPKNASSGALFVLGEGTDWSTDERMRTAIRTDLPVVVLDEGSDLPGDPCSGTRARFTRTDDFASALYLVAWAATADEAGGNEPTPSDEFAVSRRDGTSDVG